MCKWSFIQSKIIKMNNDVEQSHSPPREVKDLMWIRNNIVLPVLIVIGLIANIVCLKIINRPKVKKNSISIHLKCIAVVDICNNVLYIPQIFYGEGCIQEKLVWALYKAHLGSPMIHYTKFLTLHLLCSLTCDRFLGIFNNALYQKAILHTKLRLVLLWMYVTATTLPEIIMGKVEKLEEGWLVKSVTRITNNEEVEKYKLVLTILMVIVPAILLIIMSIAITIKITLISKNAIKQNKYKKNAFCVLILNATFISLIGLYVIVITTNKPDKNYCYSSISREAWLLGTEILTIIWGIVNVVMFLIICQEYRNEITIMMRDLNLHRTELPEVVEPRKMKHMSAKIENLTQLSIN